MKKPTWYRFFRKLLKIAEAVLKIILLILEIFKRLAGLY